LQLVPSIDYFYAAHFDAYENFASAIEMGFISNGWQLAGVLLFYVPRTIWPEKPIGSGQEMAEQLQYVFDNISMPFLGEGYVNFGIIGVLVFATFLGYVMSALDKFFSASVQNFHESSYVTAFYFYLIGALFFLLRGDLLSSFAYTTSGAVVALFVSKLMGTIDRVKFR
jgi:O-antigen polysaccharide polymerase Wzy